VNHPSSDELRAWYEQGSAADRKRIIGHLAECDACRRSLAAMAAADDSVPVSTPIVTAAEAAPLGYAARKADTGSLGAWAWLHNPLVRLAGAAAVVALVFWVTTPTVNQTRRAIPTMSTGTSGGTGTAQEFRWESPFQAPQYRVSVRDAKGVLIFSGETTASPFRPNETMRSQLVAGETYTWKVESLDGTGATIAESVPVTFKYQP
jgi:hypothetical protein